jgi:P27 family predicted phage terminase small subunit
MNRSNAVSNKVKALRGTMKSSTPEAKPASNFGAIGTCPRWLPPAAKGEWKRVVSLLKDTIQATDSAILEAYCLAYVRWQQAELTLAREGQTVSTPIVNKSTGNIVGNKISRHPASVIAKDERAAVQSLSAKLGLDPGARSRLGVPTAGGDEYERMMKFLDSDDELAN